ncbi:MAG: molybdopterin-dependent oxidoreductase [Anaerolineaceae bacterium]|nr:molybdopterin-dependent oxidoreductase [Anaerolineaceae bacterium]
MSEVKTQQHKPRIWTGAIVGGLVMAPVMALLALGDQFAGLPFLPFDVFDWISRTLPGPLVTFGIDTMVDLIRGLNIGRLDQTAKLAEQTMGLANFLIMGIVGGAIIFAILRRRHRTESLIEGAIIGAILAIPLLFISSQVNTTATASPLLGIAWSIVIFAGFGAVINWVYNVLAADRAATPAVDTPAQASAAALDRRQFLVRVGGASAALTVVGAGLNTILSGGLSSLGSSGPSLPSFNPDEEILTGDGSPLPNEGALPTPAPGTRREYTPVADHYRIDISSRPAVVAEEGYTLPITGLVENEAAFTLDEIRAMPSVSEFITMSCISNRVGGTLISTTKWTGVPMQHILEQVQPTEDAVAIRIEGADGFDEFVSLDLIREDERIMLTYAWDDAPLPERNGFPLRIHIPNRYGMKQPKWIVSMEFVNENGEGYWVRRGWSPTAMVKATSVIDTVATDAIYEQGGESFVPIGGIAWSGDRKITKVEVQVDEGEWVEAELREPMSGRAWTIWRYDWPFAEGDHTFTVRCVEDGDIPQIEDVASVRPDGASGLYSLSATVNEPEPEAATT